LSALKLEIKNTNQAKSAAW